MSSKKDRPQNKNLIPLTERSPEEASAIRSMGGKAGQKARSEYTKQRYLLGKYVGLPIVDKRTAKKFERMGFEDPEITKALEITDAIFKGARSGDPRMVEILLRVLGEDNFNPSQEQTNNLLAAIAAATKGADPTEIPELQPAPGTDTDLVE